EQIVATLDGCVQGRCINEGLENRARLALREHMIQLACAIVPAAAEGLDLTSVRIKRYQCDLGVRQFRAATLRFPFQQRIDILHSDLHGFQGVALKIQVDRSINTQRASLPRLLLYSILYLV